MASCASSAKMVLFGGDRLKKFFLWLFREEKRDTLEIMRRIVYFDLLLTM